MKFISYTAAVQAAFFTILVLSAAAAVETVWVSSDSAALKSEKTASSETVKPVDRGEKLTVVTYEDRWYKVKTSDGATGWIYRGKVSESAVESGDQEGDKESIGGFLSGLSDSSIESSSTDASRSIRGLSPEAETYASKSGTPEIYQKTLDNLMAMEISDKAVETFLEDGKVGEYAEQ